MKPLRIIICLLLLLSIVPIYGMLSASLSDGPDTISDLRDPGTNKHLLKLSLNNYAATTDFSVTLSNDQGNKIVRHKNGLYEDDTKDGNFTTFTLTMEPASPQPGTLGATEPPLPINASLSSDLSLYFNNSTAQTLNYTYNLLFNYVGKPTLFEGSYKSVLTITIADQL